MPGPNEACYSAINEYQPVAIIPAWMERLIAALLYINYCFVMAERALCSGSLHKIAPRMAGVSELLPLLHNT